MSFADFTKVHGLVHEFLPPHPNLTIFLDQVLLALGYSSFVRALSRHQLSAV